jgi:hypothetical protein
MAFRFPDLTEINNKLLIDVQQKLSALVGKTIKLLPKKNNFSLAFLAGFAGRFFDLYQNIEELIDVLFWSRSTGDIQEEQAAWFGVEKLGALSASGVIVAETDVSIFSDTISFDAGTKTISDSASGFLDAGFEAGQTIRVANSQNNDKELLIDSVSAGTINLDSSNTVEDELAGNLIVINAIGFQIDSGSSVIFGEENEYEITANSSIGHYELIPSSVTQVDNVAIFSFESPHLLATGISVNVVGASQAEYNIRETITVISRDKFSINISDDPVSPATGSIKVYLAIAQLNVESVETGDDKNLPSGSGFTISVDGVSEFCFANYDGIRGGRDLETEESFSERFKNRRENPHLPFNENSIKSYSREGVSGVTRVAVKRAYPEAGQVSVYFVRDGDKNIIPSDAAVEDVKNELLKYLPAEMETDNLIVEAPTPKVVDFIIGSLSPNTVTMQDAIKKTLVLFFKTGTYFETDVKKDDYNTKIKSARSRNGEIVIDITYTEPNPVDVVVQTGEWPVLGDIIFPS